MMPTFSERQELAKQFADHVARMRRCLQAAGKQVEEDDIVYAWAAYSDGLCAGWLRLPDDDDALLTILLQHLPTSRLTWQTTVLDAGDGSGDCILELPEELLLRTGWKAGDTLSITQAESGGWILERVE
jgi:hypothetical protein